MGRVEDGVAVAPNIYWKAIVAIAAAAGNENGLTASASIEKNEVFSCSGSIQPMDLLPVTSSDQQGYLGHSCFFFIFSAPHDK